MKTRLNLLVFTMSMLAIHVSGQESKRTFEMSSRDVPFTGKLRLYRGDEGLPIGEVEISAERYFWTYLPEEATQFQLESLTEDSERLSLFPNGSTFVTVNPARSPDKSLLNDGKVVRLPFIERTRNLNALEGGQSGWVYVGALVDDADDSGWMSLYIKNSSDLLKPDRSGAFSFSDLVRRLMSDQEIERTFIADFPLVLRDSSDSSESSQGDNVVRAGQVMVFETATRIGKRVTAKVTIK